MNEHLMETRRRSRSKTPFLRSACDHETCEHAGEEGHHHHHHKKKSAASPKVNTINETEEAVEVTSSSSTPSLKELQQKIKTSDYSSEDNSPDNHKIKSRSTLESHQNKQSASSSSMYTTTTTTSSTNIIIKSKKLGNNSLAAAATSTPKANYALESFLSQYASSTGDSLSRARALGGGGGGIGGSIEKTAERQRLKEVTQNALNAEFERTRREEEVIAAAANAAANKTSNSDGHVSRRSQNNSNRSLSRFFSNSFGSAGEQSRDISDHIAYKEYKRAGEYWKTTPKTDYTYSELSPHRRELAPGVVAMPNMSRRSLENHHERIHYMIERDPAQEGYIRRRYESSKYAQNRRETAKLVYDSGDEVDVTQFNDCGKSYKKHQTDEWWFVRILTTVVTTFSNIWQTLSSSVTAADDSALYRTRISSEQRGFFGKIGHGVSSAFIGFFRYIYLFISSVLSLDTWLLQSSNAESKGKKRFLLLLLILLPLLLLAGLYYYLHPNEPFPPTSFSQHIQTLSFPTIDLSEYVNQAKYDALKANAFERFEDFRAWTDDYVSYLRTVSQNIAVEGRKLFQREEHFERV